MKLKKILSFKEILIVLIGYLIPIILLKLLINLGGIGKWQSYLMVLLIILIVLLPILIAILLFRRMKFKK